MTGVQTCALPISIAAKKEAERKARELAKKKAEEERIRKAKEEAIRIAKAAADAKAKAEAEKRLAELQAAQIKFAAEAKKTLRC